MTPRRSTIVATALALTAILVTGCGDDEDPGSGEPTGNGIEGELVVYAAASLTESFEQIGTEFETANPGVSVTFNFAGSSTLAQQINEGAPADVFASAAPANMQTVLDAGSAEGTPTIFARNQLVIAVPAGNPDGVTGLADLVEQDLAVALCAEEVPCGAAAATAVEASGVELTPVTYEQDVRATLSRVTLGEVDAALVYRTDVATTTEVEGIEFPESASAINDYPIIVLGEAPNPAAGQAFVTYVLSPEGQAVLAEAGFQTP
jgi:molybdate transport system substrate-binding protein